MGFGDEIKQPVEEKHVRVIVITPKDDEIAAMQKADDDSKKTELDADIAKLEKVKEQMNSLNNQEKHIIANTLEEKLNSTFDDITPKKSMDSTSVPINDEASSQQ